jgi:hypothetical protein
MLPLACLRWTNEAEHHFRHDRRFPRHVIESVIFQYHPQNCETQCLHGQKSNVRVFQREFSDSHIIRVVVDVKTRPWTVVTFYKSQKHRYWNK